MKRQRKLTKKERKAHESQAAQMKRSTAPTKKPLKLADTSYVDSIMREDAARTLASVALLKDPRVNVWLLQLSQHLDIITKGSHVTRAQANQILETINQWENTNAGKLRSRTEATLSIARMLDSIIANLEKRPGKLSPQQVREEAELIGEVVDAIHNAKASFLSTAERIMLPEGQAAVSSYLYCMDKLLQGANGVIAKDLENKGTQSGIALARQLWANARNARVFEIPAEIWQSTHRLYEREFLTTVEKLRSAGQEITDLIALDMLRAGTDKQPFPEKLPFDYCYIGFGAGVMLDLPLARMRIRPQQESVVGVNILGYLICGPEKQVYEMLHVILEDTDYFLPLAQRWDNGWPFGETLAAWLVPHMVDLINEHNTVVLNHEPTRKMRDTYRKTGKGAPGFLPKPYYTVRLKHTVIDEAEEDRASETGFGRILSHRYDRRGHERCYVARGPLPIDEKTEKKLLKYEYRFIVGRPDAEDSARLAYRNFPPKRSDEWLAVKVRWIEDVVVGDEKLPYIPAVRVPERNAEV